MFWLILFFSVLVILNLYPLPHFFFSLFNSYHEDIISTKDYNITIKILILFL
ncbi:hypothetical protein CLL_A1508 [Clostridium botulinum B str. Eklund 17B (NRP)]|uniref:Uncharacterized protein n=1 Tax=Clostridium botulinum (strain Eklund 17B / Type B) TaxID=935198 RepID=B2TJW9_CLOBB|nr:hypothetical protein CLL_A1508 [Clostridium botulinum B str. Eklund 17B (NRP)]